MRAPHWQLRDARASQVSAEAAFGRIKDDLLATTEDRDAVSNEMLGLQKKAISHQERADALECDVINARAADQKWRDRVDQLRQEELARKNAEEAAAIVSRNEANEAALVAELARRKVEAWNASRAKTQHVRKALPAFESQLGHEHPHSVSARAHLARLDDAGFNSADFDSELCSGHDPQWSRPSEAAGTAVGIPAVKDPAVWSHVRAADSQRLPLGIMEMGLGILGSEDAPATRRTQRMQEERLECEAELRRIRATIARGRRERSRSPPFVERELDASRPYSSEVSAAALNRGPRREDTGRSLFELRRHAVGSWRDRRAETRSSAVDGDTRACRDVPRMAARSNLAVQKARGEPNARAAGHTCIHKQVDADAMFDRIDTNHDGVVDRREFRVAYEAERAAPPPEPVPLSTLYPDPNLPRLI